MLLDDVDVVEAGLECSIGYWEGTVRTWAEFMGVQGWWRDADATRNKVAAVSWMELDNVLAGGGEGVKGLKGKWVGVYGYGNIQRAVCMPPFVGAYITDATGYGPRR